MIRPQALRLCAIGLLSLTAAAQIDRPREHFDRATVLYDWVMNSRGEKLRTFVTRPNDFKGKLPTILIVGWLSCDTMETPKADEHDGFGRLMRRLINESGYATVRMDKPGVGESQGDCAKADFDSEISGWRAAFAAIAKYDFIDLDRVFVVGLSNGGGFSPLVAENRPVRGYISCSSWGRTWFEHMLEHERRRLTAAGKSSAEVNSAVKGFTDFYNLYLLKGLSPGEAIAKHPEWGGLWYDTPEGQYGRPAAFYQQLQALNLGEVWQKVDAPVFVIRGSNDEIMSRADSETIAQIVNREHPGHARYLEIDGMAHDLTVHDMFAETLVPTILLWMKEQLETK